MWGEKGYNVRFVVLSVKIFGEFLTLRMGFLMRLNNYPPTSKNASTSRTHPVFPLRNLSSLIQISL